MLALRKYKELVFANWPIKLTALGLATLLWAVVSAEETTTQLVPVALDITAPPGRTLTEAPPPVQVRYTGSLRELIKLFQTPPVIRKTLPDTVTGSSYELNLSMSDLVDPENVDVRAQEIVPSTISVALDAFLEKRVPVVSRVTLVPDSGFEVFGGVNLVPAVATVFGPEALVHVIDSVVTDSVTRTDLRGPISLAVALDTTGLGVVRIDPMRVQAAADIGAVSERVLMGVAVTVNSARGAWESQPSAVIVTVRGPSNRVVQLTRDSVQVVASPSEANPDEPVVLEVVTPPGITGRASPERTLVRRRNRG